MSEPLFWDEEARTPELSPPEKAVRDKFVKEYLLDYDQKAAAIRCGYGESFASTYADKFMKEPYVLQQIKRTELAFAEDADAEEEDTKRVIRAALLREAHYRGPGSSHSARVNALAKLAVIHDMEGTTKEGETVGSRSGVMEVPGIASAENWEATAAAAQKKLQDEAML